jgi:branched-chain amino acid transport system substrate-binding protein
MTNRFGRTWRLRRPWRRATPFLAVAAIALVVAGCGSSGNGHPAATATSASSATSAAASDIVGAKKPATGDPVSIGFVYDGVTDAQDLSGELTGAKASVQYINEYLGGIGGRPIKLDVCSTNQTPSGAANCVTQFVTDKVLAVANADSGQQGSMLPQLATAGIPVFVAASIDPKTLSTPSIFVMENGIAYGLAGPAKLAQRAHYSTAAIVVNDVPAAAGAVRATAPLFYGKAKVKADVVAIPSATADMTPQIEAELSHKPGQFAIIGVASFCASAIQAIKSVGFTGDIVVIPSCTDSTVSKTAGSLKGVKIITATSNDPKGAEFKLYSAVIARYAPGADLSDAVASGYQAMVGFGRALAGLTGDVTSASIRAALKTMKATPIPLADGITFKCDGKQVPIAPNICSTQVLTGTLGADGNIDAPGYSVLNVGDLLNG